jgi:endonuclease/exonuclease/phosphatase family metal-dependent hydrolase
MSRIRIATLNLLNYVEPPLACYEFDKIYSKAEWLEKQRWTRAIIHQANADIIGFQEVFSPASLQALCRQEGYPYFCCLGEAHIEHDYICSKPPVALASRYPIEVTNVVELDPQLTESLGVNNQFRLSRDIIRVSINLPDIGATLLYVLHLKSKRSSIETDESKADSGDKIKARVNSDVLAHVHGSWASTIQRGTEAAVLYHDILLQQALKKRPVVVLGDFNDTLDSDALAPILSSAAIRRVNTETPGRLSHPTQIALNQCSLYDAFELWAHKPKADSRKATHYYGAQGNVIDQILLSHDFNDEDPHSLAKITDYQVIDKHLINPLYSKDSQCSDHALVYIDIDALVPKALTDS